MQSKKRVGPALSPEVEERPLTPFELTQLRPDLGTGERPAAMAELADRQRIHVFTDGSPPETEIYRVDGAEGGAWRVDVPIGSSGAVALPGRSTIRSHPRELLSEIDPDADAPAYRPEWLDLLYVPRALPRRRRAPIQRLKGGVVRPEAVFGSDNRSELADTSWPWGCVGKVINNLGQHGSAALIGDRLIVTAGHAVPWQSNPWWMRFIPAYYNGQSLYGAGVESYVSDVRGFHPDLPGGEQAGYDWVVCRLYEPLGRPDRLGYFGTKNYIPAWNGQPVWVNMGYPINMWFVGASLEGGIPILDMDTDDNGGLELEHQGDTTPGNSGGPMFAFFGEQDPRIIGVQSGYQAQDEGGPMNVAAGGPGLTNLVLWARANWP